ncbi:MAG TPA: hypothetical protein DHV62_08145 [Elusimicrobia bacterium]|nr:hypothetical protein [Elusimicrobiota bacterium]
MNPKENYQKLKDLVSGEGISLFGVADIREIRKDFLLPKEVAEKFDFAISLGYRLSQSILETLVDRPNQIYFFHYQRVNVFLDTVALKVTQFIQNDGSVPFGLSLRARPHHPEELKEGYQALPIPASQVVDWQNLKGHLSHKQIAHLAGLGWQGKNNLLVNPNYGSQVRYVTILTNYPLTTNHPLNGSCRECKSCIAVCPAGAIQENSFSLEKCHQKLKEFIKTEKISQQICGICLKVCPGKNRLK